MNKIRFLNGKIYSDNDINFNNAIGVKEWRLNGKYHREDGPAYEGFGNKYWYLNGNLHREDGPAVEYANGSKRWYRNGKFHREDGPAIEWFDGYQDWWYHGEHIDCKDNQEFLRIIKLRVFL